MIFGVLYQEKNLTLIVCTFTQLTSILQPFYLGKSKKSFLNSIDREFEFYEFFSFLKFNEFYDFFAVEKNSQKFVILQIIDV